ncbi:MAG: hypothetical protein IKZ13_04645 [Akkermansia sp.]|nr:hypothetical protein [Akkermansia sp.]
MVFYPQQMMLRLIITASLLCTVTGAMDYPLPPALSAAGSVCPDGAKGELYRLKAELERRHYEAAIDRRYSKRLSSLMQLILDGAHTDITYPETKGCTALHYACNLSDPAIVQWLVDNGASLDSVSDRGATIDDCVGGPQAKAIRSILRNHRREIGRMDYIRMKDEAAARAAAERLQAALNGAPIATLQDYIPTTDATVRADATTLYRYVRSTRSLPESVPPNSICGRMLCAVRGSNMSETYFATLADSEVQARRTAALCRLLEQSAHFSDLLLPLHLTGNEKSITITVDATDKSEPTVSIERHPASAPHAQAQEVLLHFTGYIAGGSNDHTHATLHLLPNLHWVSVCNDTLTDTLAHYTGHSKYVRYNQTRLQMSYTPGGILSHSTSPPPQSNAIRLNFRLAPQGEIPAEANQ